MITNKAWVAGDSCSHFKTHNAVSNDFNQQEWPLYYSIGITMIGLDNLSSIGQSQWQSKKSTDL